MRPAVFAFLLAVYLALPWIGWSRAHGFFPSPPHVVSGDEPHYLLMVNSLLDDADLLLGADYERVRQGSPEAGERFRGAQLDHHTIVVDRATGARDYWTRLYDWGRPLPGGRFLPRKRPLPSEAVEVPAHPVAFPALIALLVRPLRGDARAVERSGIELVALISFSALLALYFAGRAAGLGANEAMAAALLAGLAGPTLAYGRSFFSEPLIALFLALALWAFLRRRPALCGALCFLAAAVKPPFGLVALGWAALRAREGKARAESLPLLASFGIGCALLVAFDWQLARLPIVSGTTGFEFAHGLGNTGTLFFSDEHGLFSFAPWAIAGVVAAARFPELAFGAGPVVALLMANDTQGGGYAYGPRYFVPFLPWLALATVRAFRAAPAIGRVVIALLVAVGLAIAVPGALRYGELFARPALDALK